MKRNLIIVVLVLVSLVPLSAQTSEADSGMVSTQFDMTGFPQWTKDLRRAEIVAFGSFPLVYLFTNLGTGLIVPGRFNTGEVLLIAAGGAVLIGFVDFCIEQGKRRRQARERESFPPGTPIIIQRPMFAVDESGSYPSDDYPTDDYSANDFPANDYPANDNLTNDNYTGSP